MIRISIDGSSAVPLYQQLKQAIIIDILSEKLTPGDKMPSIRSLAKILKINPNTVAKVYYNLESDNFIEGKRGSGYTVKGSRSKLDKFKEGLVEDEIRKLLEVAFKLGFKKNELMDLIGRVIENG